MRTIFVRLAAAAAVAAVAVAAGEAGPGPTIKVGRFAFALDSCPFLTTGGSAASFVAASMAPLRPESGFDCPINQLPSPSGSAGAI